MNKELIGVELHINLWRDVTKNQRALHGKVDLEITAKVKDKFFNHQKTQPLIIDSKYHSLFYAITELVATIISDTYDKIGKEEKSQR